MTAPRLVLAPMKNGEGCALFSHFKYTARADFCQFLMKGVARGKNRSNDEKTGENRIKEKINGKDTKWRQETGKMSQNLGLHLKGAEGKLITVISTRP